MDSYLQNLFRDYDANPQDIDAAGKLISALRRLHNGEEHYTPRNLPCDITTDDKLWAVSGEFDRGGGVLEWCYDRDDANERLCMMQRDSRYSNLRAHKWETNSSDEDEDEDDSDEIHPDELGYGGPIPWGEMRPQFYE